MERELQSRSLSNLRSINLKNYRTDPQSKLLYKVNSQEKDLQRMFDLNAIETQLTRILHSGTDVPAKRRATSVENNKHIKLSKLAELKKYELRRKIVNPIKSRVELKPLMLSKSRDQSKEGGSSILGMSSQREILLDSERNPYLAHSRMNSFRSLPQTNLSSALPSPKENTMEVTKLLEMEREKRETLVLPKIKKEFSPYDLIFAPNVKSDIVKPHVYKVIQGVFYATRRVKPLSLSSLQSKLVELGPIEVGKKTLVLDLDETLIFARRKDIPIQKPLDSDNEPERAPMRVKIRPHAVDFIKEMSKIFEIVIFTAAEKIYAGLMAKLLDPDQKYIKHILHRDHCLKTLKGLFLKDLRIIKDRNLKDVIIVDNFTPSFSFQLENGVPIITWQGDTNDRELKYLINYLQEASRYDDVRIYNNERLRLRELPNLPPEKLAELQG